MTREAHRFQTGPAYLATVHSGTYYLAYQLTTVAILDSTQIDILTDTVLTAVGRHHYLDWVVHRINDPNTHILMQQLLNTPIIPSEHFRHAHIPIA